MDDINRYFEILGLKPGASLDEVKQAYKDLVKVWHPDRFAHDPKLQAKAQEKLKEINEAYEKLKAYYAEYGNQPPPKEEYQSDSSYQKNDSYQENMGNKNYENSASEPPKEPPYEEKNYKNAKQNNIKSKNDIPYKYLSWAFLAFGLFLAREFLASLSGVYSVIVYAIVGGLVGGIAYTVVKGINSLNVSKKKKIRIAWIVGISGFFIVMVIFKVRFDSFKQSSPMDDCILKYQKEAKCQRASAIINLACRGKYSDTVTDCILKNIGDAQTDIAAISILRSCQSKYVDRKPWEDYQQEAAPPPAPVQGGKLTLDNFDPFAKTAPAPSIPSQPSAYAPYGYDMVQGKGWVPTPAPSQTKYESPTPHEKFNNSQTEVASIPAPEPQLPVKRITERVVTDKETGLVWTWDANLAGKPMNREDANYFIESLNEQKYGGYNGWRLPTVAELKALSKNMQSYRLDFQNIQKNYWSATFASGSNDVIASVDMNDGYVWYKSKSEKTYVLPVRDNQKK